MREKGKFFTLLIPIYDCHVSFSLGQTDDRIKSDLKRKGIKDFNPEIDGAGRCTALGHSGPYLIRLKQYPEDSRYIGVLSHEIFHLATFILKDRDIRFNMNGGDESYAYLIQYITEKVFEKLWERKN